MDKNKNKKINLLTLILLLFLILIIFLALFSISYWRPSFLNNLVSGDINLNSPEYSNTSFVIQDAKKVYISQDLKVEESFSYLSEAVVGVFSKIKDSDSKVDQDLVKINYNLNDEIFSGVIISSDGWVLLNILGRENFDKNILKNKESYVIISKKNKKIYNIEDVIDFSEKGMIFVKIKDATSFPVRNFVNTSDLKEGYTFLVYNFSGELMVNSLKKMNYGGLIKFSDNFKSNIILSSNISSDFKNNFVFDLGGNLVGLIDDELNIYPIHNFRSYIYGFLKNKELKTFNLGLYYVDLRDLAGEDLPLNGALVYNNNLSPLTKNGLAISAGIEDGDIITKINNYEINNYNNLNSILNNFLIGDRITLSVLRSGEMKEIKIDLK